VHGRSAERLAQTRTELGGVDTVRADLACLAEVDRLGD
jgi:hypothetical protein